MRNAKLHNDQFKEALCQSVFELHLIDQIPWKDINKAAGYKGVSSLKSIAQQRAYPADYNNQKKRKTIR